MAPDAVDSGKRNQLYRPLSLERAEIRLLTLEYHSDLGEPDDIVRCELTTAPLLDSLPYNAISYCWGNANTTKEIEVNGHTFQATVNLEAALRHLRSTGTRTLWVDAICINQHDTEERSLQVLRMSLIFRRAAGVIAWLGAPADESSRALWSIACMAKFHWKPTPSDVLAIQRLLERPYWLRIWIVQELIFGKVVQVTCGDRSLGWIDYITGLEQILREERARKLLETETSHAAIQQIYNLHQMRLSVIRDEPLHLLHCMRETCNALATDSRDKVYAVLGLSFDARNFLLLPSYIHSQREVAVEMFKTWASARNSLDLICLQGFGEHRDDSKQSWLPDLLNLHDYRVHLFIDYLTGRNRFEGLGPMRYNPLANTGVPSTMKAQVVPQLKRTRSGARIQGYFTRDSDRGPMEYMLPTAPKRQRFNSPAGEDADTGLYGKPTSRPLKIKGGTVAEPLPPNADLQYNFSTALFDISEDNTTLKFRGTFIDEISELSEDPIIYLILDEPDQQENGVNASKNHTDDSVLGLAGTEAEGLLTREMDSTTSRGFKVSIEAKQQQEKRLDDKDYSRKLERALHMVWALAFRVQDETLLGLRLSPSDECKTRQWWTTTWPGAYDAITKDLRSSTIGQQVAHWLAENRHVTLSGRPIEHWIFYIFQVFLAQNQLQDNSRSPEPLFEQLLEKIWETIEEGNTLFSTVKNDFIGWAHPSVQKGDHLALVKGCSTPVILRLKHEGYFYQDVLKEWMAPRYEMVGFAFVAGIMHGELCDQIGWKYKMEDIYLV